MWDFDKLGFYAYLDVDVSGNEHYMQPDNSCQIAYPSSCEDVISVGAYVNKFCNFGTNIREFYDCYRNMISPISGRGPNVDGIIKPDITAPGDGINFSLYFYPDEVKNFENIGATSISSAVVSGIIALYLEKNPEATLEEIKKVMRITAIRDHYTGYSPNNTWGYGKINALAMLNPAMTWEKEQEYAKSEMSKYDFLKAAVPNPFANETKIRYGISRTGHIRLVIYNILGERIRTLVDGKQSKGVHSVIWDGRDDKGMKVMSGVYIYRLESDYGVRFSRKMLIIR